MVYFMAYRLNPDVEGPPDISNSLPLLIRPEALTQARPTAATGQEVTIGILGSAVKGAIMT